MNFKPVLHKLKKAAPFILSGLSVIGVAATAILSAKATAKALELPEDSNEAWKYYIPTALTAIATAACIIGNGIFNRKQQASLMAAYAVLEQSYKRYRDKTKEVCGEESDKKIISSMAIEKVSDDHCIEHVGLCRVTTADWGTDDEEVKHIFYEAFSGRLFESSISKVLQAELAVSNDMADGGFVSINQFYEYLGLSQIEGGDLIGWCVCDGYYYIEFNHYKSSLEVASDGGDVQKMEALVIDYMWLPETEDALMEL